MKKVFVFLITLMFLNACSGASVQHKAHLKGGSKKQSKKTQLVWGKKIMLHVNKFWHPPNNSTDSFKPKGKIKLTISINGEIEGETKLTCTESGSFCSSITNAIKKAQPFPLPPKNSSKKDRTIILNFVNSKTKNKLRNSIRSLQVPG